MVAHVLRLRLALLVGALRGERPVRTALGFAIAVVLTVAVCVAVLGLDDAPAPVARAVIVLGGAAAFLAFLVGPMLSGTVDQLDPRRFAPFGVDERRMPWILLLASVVSVPSLAMLAIAACVAVVAIGAGVPWLLAVLCSLVGAMTTIMVARIGMAASAILLPERRSRELTVLFTIPVIVIAFPVAVYFASLAWKGRVPHGVETMSAIAGATPLAAPYGLIFAAESGDTGGAWLSGIVALATAVGIAWLWNALVRHMLTTTERPVAARERSGMGWFGIMPSTAFGAVAARSLVYWLRDRRYIVNVIVVPIAGVLTVFPLLVAGVPLSIAALVPVPVMALFFGWLPHNDVAYDSTAVWIHVASGLRGIPDRLGRLVPVTLVAVPTLAVAISVSLAVASRWHLLMPMIGLAASLLLTGLGMSSIASVIAPYAVSRPGDSPFQQPQRSSYGSFGPALTFVGAILLSGPTIWLFVLAVITGGHGAAAFWVGVLTGAVVVAGGVMLGGRIFERSGERLMEFAETT
ncbi:MULTISPECIES: hypothetical protein [Microbacterium]|uniref:hypothetical protein n=1 Tax=Microbacterium TaxID=33882 RepID=UPI00217ED46B|nr:MULTISPECIES: hypothetical protein [Microbacterium]UWF76892.1 hypothetical protein JSY13_08630 [Microbacterium neungamense]WCM55049.1 hypothetical protein JRG78_08625 [Microbacterium sp. EF45047]